MDKIITIQDFKKIQDKQDYKHLRLEEQNGATMIPYNTSGTKPGPKMADIMKRISSPGVNDGVYVVCAKNSYNNKVTPDKFYIKKGELPEESSKGSQTYFLKNQNVDPDKVKVHSVKEAIELEVKVKKLELELEEKDRIIKGLEADIDELETEMGIVKAESLEDAPDNPWMQLGEMAKSMFEGAIPVIDRHYDIQEKRMNLEANKFMMTQQNSNNNNNGSPAEEPAPDDIPEWLMEDTLWESLTEDQKNQIPADIQQEMWNEYLQRLATDDPDKYQEIMSRYIME